MPRLVGLRRGSDEMGRHARARAVAEGGYVQGSRPSMHPVSHGRESVAAAGAGARAQAASVVVDDDVYFAVLRWAHIDVDVCRSGVFHRILNRLTDDLVQVFDELGAVLA